MFKNQIAAGFKILKRTLREAFVRFLIVGVMNTIFGYGVFTSCMLLGINYKLSLFISMILGTLFNFKSLGTFVFSSRDNKLIVKFFAVYILIYFVNVGMLRVASSYFENLIIVQAFFVLPVAFLTFIMMSRFVYKKYTD
jgi:putative flippase GtrA